MSFSFGAPAATAATAPVSSAFSFGGTAAAPTSVAPVPGFGTAAAPAASAGGFGFGAAATTSTAAAPTFGGFGAAASTAAVPSAFVGGFAATATSSAPSAFGGFGTQPAAAPAFGGFGTTTTTTSAPSFGGFGTTAATGGGLFGGGAGSTFGQPVGAAKPFGAAAPLGGTTFGLANPQQQQQQQQQQLQQGNPLEQLYNSVLHCSVFGDERDAILARWNMLQASWGTGKAVHSATQPPLALSPENPLCRFKTVGYSAMPSSRNEDGLLSAVVAKKASELQSQQPQIVAGLQQVLGNRPNLRVVVEGIRPIGQDRSQVTFHVQETTAAASAVPGAAAQAAQASGQVRRLPTNEIHAFLSQPAQVQNLQKLGLESVSPKVAFTEAQIQAYLDQPPQGIDPRLWKQAQLDNPDPKCLIPVPMIGFKTLQQRIQCQGQQAKTHQGRLDAIAGDIADLQKRHQNTLAKMKDAKRRHLALAHRVLHVMVKQEETRKIGFTIQPEEEKLRIILEALQAEMSAPTQFKGRLNELLSQVRLQSQANALNGARTAGDAARSALDPFMQHDVKSVLRQQQDGIQALIKMIKEDTTDMAAIAEHVEAEKTKKHKTF